MAKLLKLYVIDYFKKLLITFVLSIIAGVVLFYPLAENLTEQILFMNWALYISMYGVFFYHFPLTNIVKWSVNLPLKKRELVLFNFIFQFIKILGTFGCIIFAFWAEYQLFEDNLYVGKLHNNIHILKEYALTNNLTIITRGFLPTMKLMILILSLSFFFTFIFNVAPYGPFKSKLITFRDTLNFIDFKVKTITTKDIFIFVTVIAFILVTPYFYSKAFIAGIFVSAMLLILYFTYEKALTFSKNTRFYCISLSLFIGVYTWLGLINHSKKILQRKDLSLMEKIEEYEFLHIDHFGRSPVMKLAYYLSNPTLCDNEIKKIFFYFRKKHYIAVNNVFKFDRSFENIILNKRKCGLKSISETINPNQMNAKMFVQYFKKWEEESINYSPENYQEIIRPFSKRSFTSDDLAVFVLSGNSIAQYFALFIMEKNPGMISPERFNQLSPHFNDSGIFTLKVHLKKEYCLSYTIEEIQKDIPEIYSQC